MNNYSPANKIQSLSLEDLDETQIKSKLNELLTFLETELKLSSALSKPDIKPNLLANKAANEETIMQFSPAKAKKKFNQTFFMLEKNIKFEEKKEMFNFTNLNINNKNNNNTKNNYHTNNFANLNSNSMHIENPSFYFISASPKKKELKNIQLRKQENINTFSKSNSLSINNSLKSSKKLNQKLQNIEQRLKAYLCESHFFFKTKSIDQFLENSQNCQLQQQAISVPDFDKFANLDCVGSRQSKSNFQAENYLISPNKNCSVRKRDSKACLFNNQNTNQPSCNKLICLNENDKNSVFSNKNCSELANNQSELMLTQLPFQQQQLQNSNVSSIHYSTARNKPHNTSNPFNNSNGTIPSIFKNFFEEKEVKELNKKRHSMAVGQLLNRNTLKTANLSSCEFKQKYQSNHTVNNSHNFTKLNLFLNENASDSNSSNNQSNKQSRISDFSLDINLQENLNNLNMNAINSSNTDSNEDSLLNSLQEGERNFSVRTNSFKIMKRNSILRERRVSCRTNGYINSFDVVVEEEKNGFGTNTSEDKSEEENEKKSDN